MDFYLVAVPPFVVTRKCPSRAIPEMAGFEKCRKKVSLWQYLSAAPFMFLKTILEEKAFYVGNF